MCCIMLYLVTDVFYLKSLVSFPRIKTLEGIVLAYIFLNHILVDRWGDTILFSISITIKP